MPRRDAPRPRIGFWRTAALVVSGALGLGAICLVVFSTTAKQSQVGVLLGAWAVFIAAPTLFGARRSQQPSEQNSRPGPDAVALQEAQQRIAQLQEAQLDAARAAAREAHKTQELELRRFGELQLARETAARREADLRLEIALRGEIERAMSEHLGSLRSEVAALRAEVVEKLGGQLRLERIETTRVIASDLEALQTEIRRLGGRHEQLVPPTPVPVPPTVIEREIVDAELVNEPEPPTQPAEQPMRAAEPAQEPMRGAEPAQEPMRGAEPAQEPLRAAQPAQEPQRAAEPAQEPLRAAQPASDPFASLPRLTPMPIEFADLIEPISYRPAASAGPSDDTQRQTSDVQAGPRRYQGRRRAGDEEDGHRPAGGRRRAPDDAPDDLLARLRGR